MYFKFEYLNLSLDMKQLSGSGGSLLWINQEVKNILQVYPQNFVYELFWMLLDTLKTLVTQERLTRDFKC
jgi:hypothetical protein